MSGSEGREQVIDDIGPPPSEESVRASFERLLTSGREVVEAEIEWARLKGKMVATGIRNAVVLAATAFVLLAAGLITLFIGIILALAPLLGAVTATLVVAGVTLAAAACAALFARRALRTLTSRGDTP